MDFNVDILTREFPPFVYGGAGVHVNELTKVLKKILGEDKITVRCFDGVRDSKQFGESVKGYSVLPEFKDVNPSLATLGIDLQIANDCENANIVHSHTWYANFAGFIAKKLFNSKHIITAHSLEPLRPWKADQLGGGYNISKWVEKTAYLSADLIIAVSEGMKKDILRCYPEVDSKKVKVIHNGIDLESFKLDDSKSDVIEKYGIDESKKTATFVGRITRQKGLKYLLKSLKQVDSSIQIILAAGAPDTPEIAKEVEELVAELKLVNKNVILINEMLDKQDLFKVLSITDCFLCPSVYEPLGIVNLEAMAFKLPVVATRTGGIPEVVIDKKTGFLVDIEQVQDGTGKPVDEDKFVNDFAKAINKMFKDLKVAKKLGEAGYLRAKEHFSWERIGEETVEVYKSVLKS